MAGPCNLKWLGQRRKPRKMEQLHCRSRFVIGWHAFNLALKHGNKSSRHVNAFLLSAIFKQYLRRGNGQHLGVRHSYLEDFACNGGFFFLHFFFPKETTVNLKFGIKGSTCNFENCELFAKS